MEGPSEPVWRAGFQQKYLTRLIASLRRRRIERRSSSARAVKSAADVLLAMAAQGRTAWSRAIILARAGNASFLKVNWRRRNLKSKRSFRVYFHSLRRSATRSPFFSSKTKSLRRLRKPVACRSSPQSHGEEEQGVESRIKILRTLVPGSSGLDTPVLLEEVADYIMALKMQVESMQALANQLTNAAKNASSCPRFIGKQSL